MKVVNHRGDRFLARRCHSGEARARSRDGRPEAQWTRSAGPAEPTLTSGRALARRLGHRVGQEGTSDGAPGPCPVEHPREPCPLLCSPFWGAPALSVRVRAREKASCCDPTSPEPVRAPSRVVMGLPASRRPLPAATGRAGRLRVQMDGQLPFYVRGAPTALGRHPDTRYLVSSLFLSPAVPGCLGLPETLAKSTGGPRPRAVPSPA